jgi:hypothetical protein
VDQNLKIFFNTKIVVFKVTLFRIKVLNPNHYGPQIINPSKLLTKTIFPRGATPSTETMKICYDLGVGGCVIGYPDKIATDNKSFVF